ncbi:MAG TPA: CsgG/HfaB family protein [Acidobacteriota bacterium]|nr:CsgG/HfaB family protein [Acidobacteriota bacterium]
MKRCYNHASRLGMVLLVLMLSVLADGSVQAQEDANIAQKLAEALDHRIYGRFDEGIAIASQMLARQDLTAQDSIAIYEVLSIIYYSKGQQYVGQSYDYLKKMSSIGPCVIRLPHDIWPKGLRRQWYSLVSNAGALTCPDTGTTDIKTIAVMPFDNFSVGKYQEELGALGAGLASFFQYDFAKISSLSVVERDKIEYVIQEQELAESGLVDQASAIKAGKLLSAHLMVFGSFTQIDHRQTRVVVRAVSVETSEIVASVSTEGKPDYFKLEKALVEDLCKELDITLTGEDKKIIDMGGTESFDATTLYAKGLEFEDKYDYQTAYEYFKQAHDLDPDFVEARRKMDIYRPLAT